MVLQLENDHYIFGGRLPVAYCLNIILGAVFMYIFIAQNFLDKEMSSPVIMQISVASTLYGLALDLQS